MGLPRTVRVHETRDIVLVTLEDCDTLACSGEPLDGPITAIGGAVGGMLITGRGHIGIGAPGKAATGRGAPGNMVGGKTEGRGDAVVVGVVERDRG